MRRWLRIAMIGLSPFLVGGAGPSARAAGTMSLKAVKINGVPIPAGPTNTVQAAPGDVVEVEIKTWGWANDIPGQTQIKAIEVHIAMRDGVVSSGCGTAIPTGWDAPLDPIDCTNPVDCPPEFPICASGIILEPIPKPLIVNVV